MVRHRLKECPATSKRLWRIAAGYHGQILFPGFLTIFCQLTKLEHRTKN